MNKAWEDPRSLAVRSSSSDGTPLTVSDTMKEKLGETVFTRYGRSCHEFLVGCQYYKVIDSSGHEWTRALPMDPRPLTKGKTAVA